MAMSAQERRKKAAEDVVAQLEHFLNAREFYQEGGAGGEQQFRTAKGFLALALVMALETVE